MMFGLAWRNIWRNPKQSLVLILAISIGVFCALFIVSFYYGMINQRIQSVISTEISHIQIHSKDYSLEDDQTTPLNSSDSLLRIIKNMEHVKASCGRINVSGMIQATAGSSGLIVHGIDPEEEAKVTDIASTLTQGKFLPESPVIPIFLSERLMSKLKVRLNSRIVFTFQNNAGEVISSAFKVYGSFKTKSSPFDLMNAYVRRSDLVSLQGGSQDYNELAILLDDNRNTEMVKKSLQAQWPSLKIQSWKEISPEMQLLVSTFDQTMYIYMGIILLALAFGMTNTMLMSVVQRTREFGMLLAFGMKKIKIFSMVMLETLFIALCGLPAGLLLAIGTIKYFGIKGINLSIYKETMESFGYDQIIFPMLTSKHLWTLMILIAVLVFIAALGPARKALSFNPIESLRKL